MLYRKSAAVMLAFTAFCFLEGLNVQAQTTIIADPTLGTSLGNFTTPDADDPSVMDTVPISGGALLRVASNGTRTVLSDFGNPAQGPTGGGGLTAVTWAPAGLLGLGQAILALDRYAGTHDDGALFTVNPSTGNRTLLSDFGNSSQGQIGADPTGVVTANGLLGLGTAYYVIDSSAGTNGAGGLFRVDPSTGNRTLLSDFGNSAQGPLGANPVSVALVPAGLLGALGLNAGFVVLDNDAGTNGAGAVFAVASNGNRTLLSDLGNSFQGQVAMAPQEIATAATGLLGLGTAIYVTDNELGAHESGSVLQISVSGNRSLVTDFGNSAQGPLGGDEHAIAGAPGIGGNLLVADEYLDAVPSLAILFQVNPFTGQRTVVTDCSNTSLGPCEQPIAVTQLP